MRVALVSMIDAAAGEGEGLRGLLKIGGRSLVRHQLGLALAFGCGRVIVVTEGLSVDLGELQAATEAAGARFHLIAGAHALLPLVTADDELLVLSDGLLAAPALALDQLEPGPAVLALPVEAGLAAGFERIDLNHAFAGMIRMPGRLVTGLADLPPEWNTHAALLRLAVQAKLPLRGLNAGLLGDRRWSLVRAEAEAHAVEPLWLRQHTAGADRRSPGAWIAAHTVQAAGPALLHAGTRPWVIGLGATVALLMALGAAWFGWRTPGFALLGFAWLQARIAALVARVERQSLLEAVEGPPTGRWFDWIIDAALVTLAAWRSELPPLPGLPFAFAWFAPLTMMLLLHLVPRLARTGPVAWWLADRLVVATGFALTSALLPFDLALRFAVIALLVWALVASPAPNRDLTKT